MLSCMRGLFLVVVLLGCGPGQAASGSGSETETGEPSGCSPGEPIWQRELASASQAYVAAMLPDDSLLLVRDTDTNVVLQRWSTDGELVWSESVESWLQDAQLADLVTDEDRVFALLVDQQDIRLVRLDVDSGELAWELAWANEQPQKYGGRLAARGSTVMAGFESINQGDTEDRDWHVLRIDVDGEAVLWEGRPMIPGNRMDALTLTPSGDALVVGALNDDLLPPEGFIRFAAADGTPSWFRPREDNLSIRQLAWSGAELHGLQTLGDYAFDILVYDESGALLRTLHTSVSASSSWAGMQVDASGIVLGAWVYDDGGDVTFSGDLYAFASDGALSWRLSETMAEPLTCSRPQLDSRGAVSCAVHRWSSETQALVKVCR
jgi:outer membrane protein assembly factor BamB